MAHDICGSRTGMGRLCSATLLGVLAGCAFMGGADSSHPYTPMIQLCMPPGATRHFETAEFKPKFMISSFNTGRTPIAPTMGGQDLYTYYFYPPELQYHAFGVHMKSADGREHYFMWKLWKERGDKWSVWMAPDGEESSFPKEVGVFQGFHPISDRDRAEAPRIRTRMWPWSEIPASDKYTPYQNVPGCF